MKLLYIVIKNQVRLNPTVPYSHEEDMPCNIQKHKAAL